LQLNLGTVATDNVGSVTNKATSFEASFAVDTDETLRVPVELLEADKASALLTCANDWLGADGALVRELVGETLPTVGIVFAHQERASGQFYSTLVTGKTFPVVGLLLKHDSIRHDDLTTFDTSRGEFILIAFTAKDFIIFGHKTLRANWNLTL